jgi:hypothetical protein
MQAMYHRIRFNSALQCPPMVRGALVVLLWLPSTLALAGQQPVFSTTFTLSGQVVSAVDGSALRRARVDVAAANLHLGSVLTDNAGRFRIEATGGGPFAMTVGKGGYAFARTTLTRAEASVPLTVRLPKGAVITGRVVDQQGTPAFASMISARRLDSQSPGFPQYFSTTTDDLGAFRLSGLSPGRFEVTAGQPRSAPTTLFEVRPGMNDAFRVSNVRINGGTVIDASPPAAASPEIRVVVSNGQVQTQLLTGSAASAGPPPRHVVTVTGSEEVNVDFVVVYNLRSDQELLEKLLAEKGQSLQSVQEAPLPAGMAAGIRGRVTTHTGQPVSGAEVRLSGVAVAQSMMNGLGQRVSTDVDGRYLLRGLLPGSYTLQVSSAGYGTVTYGQRRARQPGRTIALATDQMLDGIDVTLPRASTIGGVILDEDGEPLQGAAVQVLQVQDAGGRLVAVPAPLPRRTDDRGRYRLFGLLPGTYIVAASVDAETSTADARGHSGYAPIFFPGTTVADAATRIDLDGDTNSVNLVFTPSRAAQVRGVALDFEGPLIGGTARLIVSRRSGAMALEFPVAPLRSDGTFVFPNVPPGDYVVQVRGDGPGRTGMFGYQDVSVSDVDPAPLTVRTSRGATIEGRFVIEGEVEPGTCLRTSGAGVTVNAACATRPLSNFVVNPVALDPDRERPEGAGSLVVSSENTFYVSGLFGPTAFRLRQAPSDSWFLKAVTIGGVDVTDTGFDPGAGTQVTGDAQIVVSRGGATISGRVTDRDAPVTEYSVVVFPVFRDLWTPHSRRLRFATSSTAGTFRASGLPPGDYFVAAVEQLDGTTETGEWQNADVLGRLVAGAERITVREGETRVTTLRLIRR